MAFASPRTHLATAPARTTPTSAKASVNRTTAPTRAAQAATLAASLRAATQLANLTPTVSSRAASPATLGFTRVIARVARATVTNKNAGPAASSVPCPHRAAACQTASPSASPTLAILAAMRVITNARAPVFALSTATPPLVARTATSVVQQLPSASRTPVARAIRRQSSRAAVTELPRKSAERAPRLSARGLISLAPQIKPAIP